MLLHFESKFGRVAVDLILDFERVIDSRQGAFLREFNVHDGTNHLNNISFIHKS